MRRNVLSGSVAAVWLAWGIAAAAQAPSTPASPPSDTVIIVTGCVKQESAVLKGARAAGDVPMSNDFVLTRSTLNPLPDRAKADTVPATDTPVGTAGSAAVVGFGKVYRVTGDKENDLKPYVGQRVEITGEFKNEAEAKAELASRDRSVTGELTPANTPEIIITAIKPLSGSCAAGADR
jgi:hypothetical protein